LIVINENDGMSERDRLLRVAARTTASKLPKFQRAMSGIAMITPIKKSP